MVSQYITVPLALVLRNFYDRSNSEYPPNAPILALVFSFWGQMYPIMYTIRKKNESTDR
jgi:hypothetical protein